MLWGRTEAAYADSVRVDVRPEEDFRGDGGEGKGSLERGKLSRECKSGKAPCQIRARSCGMVERFSEKPQNKVFEYNGGMADETGKEGRLLTERK